MKWNLFRRLPQYPKLGESLGETSQWKFNVTVSQVPTGASLCIKLWSFQCMNVIIQFNSSKFFNISFSLKSSTFFHYSQGHSICLQFHFNSLHSRPQTSQSSKTNLLLDPRIHAVLSPFLMPLNIVFSLPKWWSPLTKLSVKSSFPCPGRFKYSFLCHCSLHMQF